MRANYPVSLTAFLMVGIYCFCAASTKKNMVISNLKHTIPGQAGQASQADNKY